MAVKKTTFFVSGMDCASCVLPVQKGLKALAGVKDVNVNYVTQKAVVEFDDAKTNADAIAKVIEKSGYKASVL